MWLDGVKMLLNVWLVQKKALSLQRLTKFAKLMEQISIKMERVGLEMQADREEVAVALKTWRLRTGKSQEDVAKAWNMSRWTIIRAETGKPISWMMAYRIFACLARELEKENRQ